MRLGYLLLFVLYMSANANALEWQENPILCRILEQSKTAATIVVYDPQRRSLTGCNKLRAERRFVPASTFKIANALIGLSVGAVTSVDQVLPYGGQPQFLKAWERDMSLREGMPISNVPIYQELARRVGIDRMATQVRLLGYGNQTIGSVVDRFWLDGPLEISAIEQATFVSRLAKLELPTSVEIQRTVKEILFIEQRGSVKLYSKTGWQNAPDAGVGWWVGWLEQGDFVYGFALNADMLTGADPAERAKLGTQCLEALGLLTVP